MKKVGFLLMVIFMQNILTLVTEEFPHSETRAQHRSPYTTFVCFIIQTYFVI